MSARDEYAESGVARGPLAWMVGNRVTPNLLMIFLLLGGFFMAGKIKKEVFPEFSLDSVNVSVSYPGASPEEVEQGIVLSIEEAVRGIDGVDEVRATAAEGVANVSIEVLEGVDPQQVYQDVQQEVDRIRTFPDDAEEPSISLASRRREVVQLQLYGDVSEWSLRNLAEEVRDRLLQDEGITQVDLRGVRDYEVHVEVSQESLRAYGLTLDDISRKISSSAVEVPGGNLKTEAGEILVRFKERKDWASEFAGIPIVTSAGGSVLTLGELAEVREGFADSDNVAVYNGKSAVGVGIYRVGSQTPIGVADAVRAAMHEISADLPPGVNYAITNDSSKIYSQRLHLLLKNAFLGLVLVLLVLGLFLEFKLAFWVTMGIPTSFLGAMLFIPVLGVTINMISMFAFIVALGIVVDDAIVAGENIYDYRQQGMGFFEAAVRGARDVAVPITFSILTNIVAFMPLYFVPGFMGKIWKVIPTVVVTIFLISWVESLLVLPAHLAHTRSKPRSRFTEAMHRKQQAFTRKFSYFIENVYGPFLERCLRWRYLTVAVGLAFLITVIGYVGSGRMGLVLMPRVESDRSVVSAVLPYGSPLSKVEGIRDHLVKAAEEIVEENGGNTLAEGVFAVIDGNTIEINVFLTDANVRPITTGQMTQLWRERTGEILGLESIQFAADRGGPGSGAALTVELSHKDIDVLDRASAALAERLAEFPNTKDIDDGYTPGKAQFDFKMKPEGRSLGLNATEVARQIRNAFYGAEAMRQQRGRNEVKAVVRLPEEERSSEYDIEQLLIRTPSGRDVPLMEVAEVERGRSYTSIRRRDGRRTVTVTADVEPIGQTGQVTAELDSTTLPLLVRDYPGLSCGYQGRQADMKESMQALLAGLLLALLMIYFLLAIPFRSYTQPVIVMVSIPFGIVGAVLGHSIMGYDLSVISMMGIIALSGVVVNDSLVLIDYANRQHKKGNTAHDAIYSAGIRRFRPILLTTLTTFGGLAPMIFETSRQARFMIPMALSLGYGILFATLISLVLVPCLYLIIEDVARADAHEA
ncbi:MAG: efflux RND transporter permease subunit [Verrucomicrobia bacterium]|nr:efflux RND transporter permease subunit [Verrucomicrobiota bacterium]